MPFAQALNAARSVPLVVTQVDVQMGLSTWHSRSTALSNLYFYNREFRFLKESFPQWVKYTSHPFSDSCIGFIMFWFPDCWEWLYIFLNFFRPINWWMGRKGRNMLKPHQMVLLHRLPISGRSEEACGYPDSEGCEWFEWCDLETNNIFSHVLWSMSIVVHLLDLFMFLTL